MSHSKITKAIISGGKVIGNVWSKEGREIIVLDKNVELNLNHTLIIKDIHTSKIISGALWLDIITNQLTVKEDEDRVEARNRVLVCGWGLSNTMEKYAELKSQLFNDNDNSVKTTGRFRIEDSETILEAVMYTTNSNSMGGNRYDTIYFDMALTPSDMANMNQVKKDRNSKIILF